MNSAVDVSMSQLKWRCRRGMLELDILLNNFLEKKYNDLSQSDAALFSTLLDYQDQVLLDLLLGKKESSNANVLDLVARIRSSCNDGLNLRNRM